MEHPPEAVQDRVLGLLAELIAADVWGRLFVEEHGRPEVENRERAGDTPLKEAAAK